MKQITINKYKINIYIYKYKVKHIYSLTEDSVVVLVIESKNAGLKKPSSLASISEDLLYILFLNKTCIVAWQNTPLRQCDWEEGKRECVSLFSQPENISPVGGMQKK
jgi:hypothetical protein